MTWQQYIEYCAKQLANCLNTSQFNTQIANIEKTIRSTPPPSGKTKFWNDILQIYKKLPKPLLHDSIPAAALHDLMTIAEKIIQQRASNK